jgi:hypothetical protein
MRVGRGWRVLLPGEPRSSVPAVPQAGPDGAAGQTADQSPPVSESLIALVRDLQRQNLALAGHIGYLQNRLSIQAEVGSEAARLGPGAVDAAPVGAVDREEHESALRAIEELRRMVAKYEEERAAREAALRKRRWWRRAR